MSASDNLSGTQFKDYTLKFKPAPEDDDMANHRIIAQHKGRRVGKMEWDTGTGDIQGIEVHPRHQRKGIATAMWNHAQEVSGNSVGHSTIRSDEGDKWAQSVGGDIPPRSKD
jgi:ribosomal protein S18 acetylase RimI-like enzyme